MPLSVNKIKLINSLKLKKNRSNLQLFVAEGEKVVGELINASFTIRELYTTLPHSPEGYDGAIEKITEKELSRISRLSTPNKVLALVEIPSPKIDKELAFSELIMVLDGINDPGNLGTIIRIADWFGIQHIICSNESVDAYNPKTIQSSMGSIARTKVHYANLVDFFDSYSTDNRPPVYGTLLNGENLYNEKPGKSGLLVFGSESHGISEALLPYISKKLTIPKYGEAESLNVATAAAIVCAEFKRN